MSSRMIDVSKLKITQVSEVSLGDLVLYKHDARHFFAIRVDAPSSDAFERVGLLVLCFGSGAAARADTALFSEVRDDPCLHIGKPAVTWDGDPESITPVEGSLGTQSPLVVTPEGLALIGRLGPTSPPMVIGVSSGTPLQIRGGYYVKKWQIGVAGIDGKFCALVKYPDDYEPKAA